MDGDGKTIKGLVEMFADGEIKLPEIQRKYVWTKDKVRALIDSIYKGYPSGSILLWKADGQVETRPAAIPAANTRHAAAYLLLDGQQRLTSLLAVIRGEPVKTRAGNDVSAVPIELYFNMNHPERMAEPDDSDEDELDGGTADDHRIFHFKNAALVSSRHWISVTQLFKEGPTAVLIASGIQQNDPKHQMYLDRLNTLYNKLETYTYPVQILGKNMSYEEVADIFVRLNMQGTKLLKADLALAQVTSRWTGAMDKFTDASNECRQKGFDLDERFLIKCLVSVSTNQSKFKSIAKIPIPKLRDDWEKTKRALEFTIEFFKSSAHVETTDVLPSRAVLVPIVRLAVKNGYRFDAPTARKALRWIYAALIWGRYSGASETMLDEDLASIRDNDDPLVEMLDRIRRRSGRLKVNPEDLKGKTMQSPLFSMMYVLARESGARDWATGLALSIGAGRDFNGMHGRIFPRQADIGRQSHAVRGRRKSGRTDADIANTVFVTKHAAGIVDREPSSYMPDIINRLGEEALRAQSIPIDPTLWVATNYEDFLAWRRSAVASAINNLMESLDGPEQPPLGRDLEIIRRGESATVELKSSMLYDRDTKQKNPALKAALLKEIAAFLNTDGGIVYVGVADNCAVLGIEDDYRILGSHKDWDGWSQAFVNGLKMFGMPAAACVSHERVEINGKTIAKIAVKKSSEPAWLEQKGEPALAVRKGVVSMFLNAKDTAGYIAERFHR